MSAAEAIEVEAVPECPSCRSIGRQLYSDVHDHTFGAPGTWALSRCSACELIWLDPRPTAHDIGKVYETYYTHGIRAEGSAFRAHVRNSTGSRRLVGLATASLRRARDAVLAVRFGYAELSRGKNDRFIAYTLGLLPGVEHGASLEVLGLKASERGRLLDVGSGNGAFLSRMKSLGWECVGNETDAVAAKFARDNFSLDVYEGNLADAGFSDGSFDVVTLSHVIEHVHSPLDLIMECRRVLKPGGKLIVLTPNTRSLGHRMFGRSWRGLEPPRHLHCFTPQVLQAFVERTGMELRQLTTESRMMRAIWYASRLIQRAEQPGRQTNTVVDYVAAYTMQLAESLARRVVSDVGEEIMLVATKPAQSRVHHPALTH